MSKNRHGNNKYSDEYREIYTEEKAADNKEYSIDNHIEKKRVRKPYHQKRWDITVGIITLLTIIVFSVKIYSDVTDKNPFAQMWNDVYGFFTNIGKNEGNEERKNEETDFTQESKSTEYNYTVCLDAGAGGSSNGVTSGTVKEKNVTLELVEKIKTLLEEKGFKVVLTRNTDADVTQDQRVEIGKAAKADVFISVQINSSENKSASGAESWIHTEKTQGASALSDNILKSLEKDGLFKDRGVKTGTVADKTQNYTANSHSQCESCVLMIGFITNESDKKILTDRQDEIASSVSCGIIKYFDGIE